MRLCRGSILSRKWGDKSARRGDSIISSWARSRYVKSVAVRKALPKYRRSSSTLEEMIESPLRATFSLRVSGIVVSAAFSLGKDLNYGGCVFTIDERRVFSF